MPEVVFAPFAEDFIETVGTFLSEFDLSLKLLAENNENQSRIYEIEASDGPVTVLFHRTGSSFLEPNPEYRARVIAEIPPEFAEFVSDKEDLVNRAALLGAMLVSEKVGSKPMPDPASLVWHHRRFTRPQHRAREAFADYGVRSDGRPPGCQDRGVSQCLDRPRFRGDPLRLRAPRHREDSPTWMDNAFSWRGVTNAGCDPQQPRLGWWAFVPLAGSQSVSHQKW